MWQFRLLVGCALIAACAGDEDSMYSCSGVAPEIVLLQPAGGEVWVKGRSEVIAWEAAGDTGLVRVELVRGEQVAEVLADGLPETGELEYTVSPDLADGDDYRVRVVAMESGATTESAGPFRVELREVVVAEPNGGEAWIGGETMEIRWASNGLPDGVDIDLLRGGEPDMEIARGIVDTGSHMWSVPIELPEASDYSVRVADSGGGQIDESDASFDVVNWQFRRELTITALVAFADHPVLVVIPAGDPALGNGNGADVRFATDADRQQGFDLEHFVESWSASGARVWVRVPAIQPPGTTIYQYYGSSSATTASNIDAVFPNRYETAGDTTLTGSQVYDAFIVRAGDTLTVQPGAVLDINAHLISIAGVVDGDGAGYFGAGGEYTGDGPGGGDWSDDAGAGGGGYGGPGGAGGRDSGDWEGAGGLAYGDASSVTIQAGSGGGGTNLADGGNGGAAVWLSATRVVVTGSVWADGYDGEALTGDQSRGGGGGAGGGILMLSHDLQITGAVSAVGGAGGPGTRSAHDGGGGGGGGRIKLFYSGNLDDTVAALDVSGGAGGPGGDASDGIAGGVGTIHRGPVQPVVPVVEQRTIEALY